MALKPYKNIFPRVGQHTYVDEHAVLIGDVVLGDDCSVWPMVVIRGDVHHIRIGHRTNIQDGSVLHVTHYGEYNPTGFPLTIGDDVTIGHNTTIHACTIGHRCLIGMGAVLLDNAVIQDNVMIGAGALVPPGKILESGFLYVGSPVKKARALSAKEIEFLSYSALHYKKLKDEYLSNFA